MKRIVSGLVAAMLVSAGCDGPLVDDTAATVDGVDISVSEVEELAAAPEVVTQAQSVEGLVDASETQIGGSSGRVALGFLIQTELLAAAARRAGLDVDASSSPPTPSGEGLSPEVTAVQDRFAAYSQALVSAAPDDEIVDAFLVAQDDFLESGVCIEGVGVPTDAAAGVADLLDAGISFDQLAAEVAGQAQVFGTESNPACVGLSDLPDQALEDLLAEGEIGQVGQVELTGPDGSTDVLFLRPVSRGGERDNEAERRWAGTLFIGQSSVIPAWLAAMTGLVDVDVDPRFGELAVAEDVSVVPPIRPTIRVDAADLLGV